MAMDNHTVDFGQILRALDRAPSVHGTQPWLLEPGRESVGLVERFDVTLPASDPDGRDRAISCGAGLTNITVAVRGLGGAATVSFLPEGPESERVATVATTLTTPPTSQEQTRYAALHGRHNVRAPFSPRGLTWQDRDALTTSLRGDGVTSHVVHRTECPAIAGLLDYAALVCRGNKAYQRELLAWQPSHPRATPTLPWSGPVRPDTHLPDHHTLTDRLMRESLLIVLTPDDTRRDRLLAGMAMERAWLTAVSRGLVASVVTQPWQLPEVRESLVHRLHLPAVPQVMLRVGRPLLPAGPNMRRARRTAA
jgi:nitroreductase